MKTSLKIFCLSLFILWGIGSRLWAQQKPQFTQYMVNNFLLNPAVTGAYDYADIRTGFRNQWTGLQEAPRTFFLSAHSPLNFGTRDAQVLPTIGTIDYHGREATKSGLGLKHGVGALMLYDQTGPLSRIMFHLNYALHFTLKDDLKASLGVQGGFVQYRQDNSDLVPDPLNPGNSDPALGGNVSSSFLPDLGLGLLVHNERFYAGFSMSQVLQNQLSYSDIEIGPVNQLVLHYYLSGGYRLDLNPSGSIQFIPSVLIKFLKAAPASVDFNARLAFALKEKNHLWFGLSYRYDDALAALLGMSVSKLLDINYSYDYSLTGLSDYNSGTHEISLGIRIPNRNIQNYNHRLF